MANLLSVQGNFQRHIRLQTPLEVAYTYFTDFNYVLPRLPEIERVLRYRDGRYRMIFAADDGRGHEMGIVFDIRHELLENRHIKMVSVPVSQHELSGGDSLSRSTGPLFPGMFSGEVVFNENNIGVEVVYRVNLLVEIEVPRFLNFMPRPVLQKLADSLMQLKLHTVGDGLANRLTTDFGEWHSQREVDGRAAHGIKIMQMAVPELN